MALLVTDLHHRMLRHRSSVILARSMVAILLEVEPPLTAALFVRARQGVIVAVARGGGRSMDIVLPHGPDEPRGAAGTLPGPVLLEVVFAGLDAVVGEEDDEADEPVECGVDKEAAVETCVC